VRPLPGIKHLALCTLFTITLAPSSFAQERSEFPWKPSKPTVPNGLERFQPKPPSKSDRTFGPLRPGPIEKTGEHEHEHEGEESKPSVNIDPIKDGGLGEFRQDGDGEKKEKKKTPLKPQSKPKKLCRELCVVVYYLYNPITKKKPLCKKHKLPSDASAGRFKAETIFRFRKHGVSFHFTFKPLPLNKRLQHPTSPPGTTSPAPMSDLLDRDNQLVIGKIPRGGAKGDAPIIGRATGWTFKDLIKAIELNFTTCECNVNRGKHCVKKKNPGGRNEKCIVLFMIPHIVPGGGATLERNGLSIIEGYAGVFANCYIENINAGRSGAHELAHILGYEGDRPGDASHSKNDKDLMSPSPYRPTTPKAREKELFNPDFEGNKIEEKAKKRTGHPSKESPSTDWDEAIQGHQKYDKSIEEKTKEIAKLSEQLGGAKNTCKECLGHRYKAGRNLVCSQWKKTLKATPKAVLDWKDVANHSKTCNVGIYWKRKNAGKKTKPFSKYVRCKTCGKKGKKYTKGDPTGIDPGVKKKKEDIAKLNEELKKLKKAQKEAVGKFFTPPWK
jgi:hypothetical protein